MATIVLSVSQLKAGLLVYGYGPINGKDCWADGNETAKTGWLIEKFNPTTYAGVIANSKSGYKQPHQFGQDPREAKGIRVEKPEPVFNEWGEDAL